MAKPDPIAREQADAKREVTRLLKIAERLAVQAEKPEAGAQALIGIASLRSRNAGLDKRHASKAEVHTGGPDTTDEWLRQKAAEEAARAGKDNDDG